MEPYRLKDLFRDAADLVFAGFLFLAATALSGGILAGAALKALFAVGFRVVGGKKSVRVFADFWTAFKDGFLFATVVWLLSAGMGTGLWFIVTFALDRGEILVAAAGIASAVLLALYLSYFYPMLAAFETDKPRTMLKNAFLLAAGHPLHGLLVLGGLAVPVLLFGLWYGTILFSVALYAAIECIHLKKLFAPYLAGFSPAERDGD